MPALNEQTRLNVPPLTAIERVGWTLLIDGEGPNWISTDARGAWVFRALAAAPFSFATLVERYAAHHQLETGKAWVHMQSFVGEAIRHGLISLTPFGDRPYLGRAHYLRVARLRECWLHTNNSCNLSCAHCLVSSSPKGESGLPASTWRSVIAQAVTLGVDRFYITGGEPFIRPDLPELIQLITTTHKTELIILTNATLFAGPRKALLEPFDRARVKFQVSLDGSTPQINDPIRGAGSFKATVEGMKELRARGFDVTMTTVATSGNLHDLPSLTQLAASCGVRSFNSGMGTSF